MLIYVSNCRQAPSVESQAEVDLYHWRILQLSSGLLRIAAQLDSGSFRVTTALSAIDLPRRVVRTDSGRRYRLCAPPEDDPSLAMLMIANVARGSSAITHDVSEVVWSAVEAGAWLSEGESLIPAMQ